MNVKWVICVMFGAASVFGQGTTNFEVRAMADKVNLRARPTDGTEVVAQARDGQPLTVVQVEGEWRGVLSPTNAQVWIKSQFVKKGLVAGEKIKLRCGPGISYRDVGTLNKNTPVTELETHGEWIRIAAPSNLVLWVHESMVIPVILVATNSPVESESGHCASPVVTQAMASAMLLPPRDLPAGLTKEQLAPVLGQGVIVECSGTVERVPLAFLRGVNYRLVGIRDGIKVTVCFLEGNESQMPSLVGQRLIVKGREYWLKSQRYAVVYPELITPVLHD